jgi:hypothetical protein
MGDFSMKREMYESGGVADTAARGGSGGSPSRRVCGSPGWFIGALYLAEVLAVVMLLLAYRAEGKPSIEHFIFSRPGILLLAAGVILFLTLTFIVRQVWQALKQGSRGWQFAVVMNALVMGSAAVIGEVGLRLIAVESNTEERVWGNLLYPRKWDVVRANFQEVLRRAKEQPTFWVEDPDLGWTIGPNRSGADGLYFSSAEGIRSHAPGISYRDTSPSCRIAVIGDSFTFGEEVAYEDSWPYLLGREIGSGCQVLNFGVGGYGVGQMYLRYMKEVRSWHPDLVVLAFITHDIVRTFSIYSFLLFADGDTPFPKPRFVLHGEELAQLNKPLITTEAVFAKPSIRDLPFIEYDISYRETEWDRPAWRYFSQSYLFRLLTSFFPLHEEERPQVSRAELQKVNAYILSGFEKSVTADGGKPLIVYLPTVEEIPEPPQQELLGPRTLREGKIPHLNIRDCMATGYSSGMFMPPGRGQHFSPQGNRVAAQCLKGPIESLMAGQRSS